MTSKSWGNPFIEAAGGERDQAQCVSMLISIALLVGWKEVIRFSALLESRSFFSSLMLSSKPEKWTCSLLKEFCVAHDLKRSGNKAELLDR